jgi:TrmH family RNA methyltransferase
MPKVEAISSPANPLVKDIRGALRRGPLTEGGYCVAESFHLLEEALRSGSEIGAVVASERARAAVEERLGQRRDIRMAVVSESVFGKISATESSQGVIVLVKPRAWQIDGMFRGDALVIVLDGVQDPGNAGTILRAAEAFGASGAVFLKGSVNPYNAKALRASAGSVFHLPLMHGVAPAVLSETLALHNLDVYAAVPVAGPAESLTRADLKRPCALIIGSEAHGITPEVRSLARAITIPTRRVESLNAAMAATVLLYEAHRQRIRQP